MALPAVRMEQQAYLERLHAENARRQQAVLDEQQRIEKTAASVEKRTQVRPQNFPL